MMLFNGRVLGVAMHVLVALLLTGPKGSLGGLREAPRCPLWSLTSAGSLHENVEMREVRSPTVGLDTKNKVCHREATQSLSPRSHPKSVTAKPPKSVTAKPPREATWSKRYRRVNLLPIHAQHQGLTARKVTIKRACTDPSRLSN